MLNDDAGNSLAKPTPYPDTASVPMASVFHALGDVGRLQCLELIAKGDRFGVTSKYLLERFKIEHFAVVANSTLADYLSVLRDAGLISSYRAGVPLIHSVRRSEDGHAYFDDLLKMIEDETKRRQQSWALASKRAGTRSQNSVTVARARRKNLAGRPT